MGIHMTPVLLGCMFTTLGMHGYLWYVKELLLSTCTSTMLLLPGNCCVGIWNPQLYPGA